jgi:hypothetical protein
LRSQITAGRACPALSELRNTDDTRVGACYTPIGRNPYGYCVVSREASGPRKGAQDEPLLPGKRARDDRFGSTRALPGDSSARKKSLIKQTKSLQRREREMCASS